MRHSVEAKSIDAEQSAAIPPTSAKGRVAKRARKPAQKSKKFSEKGSGIRETEEARALLENQLHSLYWWVFNACKMKGFIRAKGLHQAEESRGGRNDDPLAMSLQPRPMRRRKSRTRAKK